MEAPRSSFLLSRFQQTGERYGREEKRRKITTTRSSSVIVPERRIPEDIIFDILSRLPSKQLLRLKSVSKPWLAVISSPHFVDHHHQRSKRNPRIMLAVLMWMPLSFPLYSLSSLYSLSAGNGPYVAKPMLHKEIHGRELLRLVSLHDCDGLVVLTSRSTTQVCNPSTGERLTLPAGTPGVPNFRNQSQFLGFGLDPVSKQYKVVRCFYRRLDIHAQSYKLGCEVFILGHHHWRASREEPPYPIEYSDTCIGEYSDSVFANGCIYWKVDTVVPMSSSANILAFDLGIEKFNVIPSPACSSVPIRFDGNIVLRALEGNLCVLNIRRTQALVDIWMMKKKPEGHCWTREYSVNIPENIPFPPLPVSVRHGKFVLNMAQRLVCYDPKSGGLELLAAVQRGSWDYNPTTKEDAVLSICISGNFFQAGMYTESLISVRNGK